MSNLCHPDYLPTPRLILTHFQESLSMSLIKSILKETSIDYTLPLQKKSQNEIKDEIKNYTINVT